MYQIDRLKYDDIDSLYVLLNDIFDSGVKRDLLYKLVDNNEVIDLVCRLDNKIVGHAMVEIRDDLFTGEKYFFLNYFCVLKDYRCRGIGSNLIKELETIAIDEGIDFMRFTSNNKRIDAHNFYKNRGYVIRNTSVFIKYFKENL